MLHSLLLKEQAAPALGDNLHHVILSCRPEESIIPSFYAKTKYSSYA
jgi:hypothetical protein